MSYSQLIEIVSATGEGFGFGPAGADGAGEPVRQPSVNEWKAWLIASFSLRFQEQAERWETVLNRAGSRQTASSPRITFKRIADLMEAGKLEARRMPPHKLPPKTGAAESGPTESMRSQQAGNGRVADTGAGASASKGVARDTVGVDSEKMQCKGDPVAPATGEEILVLDDFTVAAPMPLQWRRMYRSRYCNRQLWVGAGWFTDALRVIWQDEEATWLLDHEARPVRLPLLAKGELAWQAASGQRLERKADDRMMLTERDGRAWVFAPDGEGHWRPISVQNTLGHQWLFAYDAQRRLARLEVSQVRVLEFSYGTTSELREIALRHGDVRKTLASYDYDGDGNLTSATTDRGTERYGYRDHLLIHRELATGYHFVFHWDGSGPEARCLRTHGEDGHFDFRFDYQPDQFLTRVTDSFGQVQTFHYDEQSRITAREDADGGVHQWAYDSGGRLAAYRLPDGRTTRYGYDALGRGVLEQLPDGREHKRTFNVLGFCVAEQWPDGRTTARRFDPLGRLLQEHRPDGSEWQYHYDGNGWLSEAVSNTGEVRRTGFGNHGELFADEHEGALARYAFDEQGRVKGRLVQDLITEYDYRGGQVSAIHQYPEQAPDQRRTRFYRYDNAGRLTGFTAATGEHHGFEYDGLAKPTRYQRPDGKQVLYQYDKAQRLTHVIRADGQKWALGYDSKGQVNTCQAPDGRHIEFRYDAAGDIIHREQAGDWVQHLKRDHGGRVLQQTSQGKGRSPVSKQLQYDVKGRRTIATCADRRLSWQYDNHGRVTEHSQDQHRVSYGVGPGQQLNSLELPDGTYIQYDYDRQGRWQGVLVNGKPILQREFDDQGREQARQAGDHNRQTQVWDRHDCLINRRWQGAESSVRRYSWDAESRLEEFSDTLEGTRTFKRDPQGQLIADNQQTFAYDPGGNRLPADATLQQDRLIKTDTATRKYDALGAETEVRGTYTDHRQFDAEGQLTVFRREGLYVQYGYDALGRRAWRKREHGTTTYLWHNDVLLGEQSPNGQWQWYLRDPQTDAPLFTLINGKAYYYELDWRNMPVRLWDPKGKRVWQANADAWGKCQPVGEVHQPIRLPGQFEDELSGLYNNRFRDYDPKTGRYLTPDPLGIKGGLNSYRYTPNPVDYIDPLGLNTCSASSPGPEEAENGEMAPVSEDAPALQNVEVAGAAAAVARAPVPAPTSPTSPGVTRIAVSTAANDAVYASQRSWLARALPIASTAAAFVGGMLYSPSLGGGLEEITAPDGTVYSKNGDERIWNASGPDGAQWQTVSPQEDMEYRAWLANGGEGSFSVWLASGKPVEPDVSLSNHSRYKRPQIDIDRPIESPHYTTVFEVQLTEGQHYPGVSDYQHFQESNRQLHEAFNSDSGFSEEMDSAYPGIVDFVKPGARGRHSGKTPSKLGLTWHHNPHKPGSMELVPVNHHQAPGPVQNSLHPNQQGGMELWGGGR